MTSIPHTHHWIDYSDKQINKETSELSDSID
jgi:hypothetical protein